MNPPVGGWARGGKKCAVLAKQQPAPEEEAGIDALLDALKRIPVSLKHSLRA